MPVGITPSRDYSSAVCQSASDASHCSVLHELSERQAALTEDLREDEECVWGGALIVERLLEPADFGVLEDS